MASGKPFSQPANALPEGIAHDLNNPLTVVIANIDVALRELASLRDGGERCVLIEERLGDARIAAERIHRMLRELALGKSTLAIGRPLAVAHAVQPTARSRVLVVDDERLITKALQRTLSLDHDVTTLSDARQALLRLERGERFDLILCDLMMPQMTGMELHAALLRIAPDQAGRMVFLTGDAFTARARAFLDQVPNRHIEKPFDTRRLRALVNDCLR
ncbi:MAG TPA: response regulator [Polyangiales bacterium]